MYVEFNIVDHQSGFPNRHDPLSLFKDGRVDDAFHALDFVLRDPAQSAFYCAWLAECEELGDQPPEGLDVSVRAIVDDGLLSGDGTCNPKVLPLHVLWLIKHPNALEGLRAAVLDSDSNYWKSGGPHFARNTNRRIRSYFQNLPSLAKAACILLPLAVLMGAGVGIGVFGALSHRRKAAHMDTYVEHPERNPIYVRKRTIVAKEIAKAGVIESVRMTISTLERQEIWQDEVAIRGEFGEAVPFRLEYEAPADGQILMVKVEYVPVEEAHLADPQSMRAERLTHATRAACLPKGVLAYFPAGLPPQLDEHVDHVDQRWVLKIRTRTSTGYATIGVKIGGAGEYVVLTPQPVSKEGQELTFDVIPGAYDSFTAVPFASETGTAEELASNIEELKLQALEQGEPLTVRTQPIVGHSEPLAHFVNPPEQVQGVNHVLQIEVSPQLLKQRDVWVGLKPVPAPDQIWLQGSRVSTSRSSHNVYLGLNGVVNEKFEVLVLSVPRGTFQREGPFRTNEVEKKGVEILASTVIHRTE